MVFRHISKDIKDCILWLRGNGYITDDISDMFGVSLQSIQRWQSNFNQYGSVIPPQNPLQGRPHTLNADQRHDLFTMLDESPELFLDEIQDWVAVSHDIGLSKSALHYLIRDAGLTYKLLHKAASERDEEAREAFRTFMREHLVAEQVVTADETSKDDRTIFRRWGRSPLGNQATIDADFVRGERFSIVAAITVDGYIGTCVVPGSVDGDEFFDFIVEDVVCHCFSSNCD